MPIFVSKLALSPRLQSFPLPASVEDAFNSRLLLSHFPLCTSYLLATATPKSSKLFLLSSYGSCPLSFLDLSSPRSFFPLHSTYCSHLSVGSSASILSPSFIWANTLWRLEVKEDRDGIPSLKKLSVTFRSQAKVSKKGGLGRRFEMTHLRWIWREMRRNGILKARRLWGTCTSSLCLE